MLRTVIPLLLGAALIAAPWPADYVAFAAAEAKVVLTLRDSTVETNAQVLETNAPDDGDADAGSFTGPGVFNRTVESTADFTYPTAASGHAEGHATQSSTVTNGGGTLFVHVDDTFSASATASGKGPQDKNVNAVGQSETDTDVDFKVEDGPAHFRIFGKSTVPEGGDRDISLSGADLPDSDGNFDQSGTLQPGNYSFSAGASAKGEALDDVKSGSGSFEVTLEVTKAPAPTAVKFTAGPTGLQPSPNARFAFTTVDPAPPAGTFECSLDSAAFAACTSPRDLTALASDEHSFRVRYHPTGGEPGTPVERKWTICSAHRVGKAVAQGCFTEREKDGNPTGVFETAGEAWVGGFHLKPRPGGKLVVQNRQLKPLAAEGTGVDWLLGSVRVPAPLGQIEPFSATFGSSFNSAGSFERFLVLPLLEGLSAQITTTWDADGKGAKLEASVSMEELSKAIGEPLAGKLGLGGRSIGTLAGKLGLALSNGKPTEVTAGELELPEFAIELDGTNPKIKQGFGGAKFKAANVGGVVEWSGEVTTLFPWEGSNGLNQGSLKGRLFMRDLRFAGIGMGLAGFEIPIGKTDWDLTGIDGTVRWSPKFDFDVTIAAKEHTVFDGVPLLKLTGSLKGLAAAVDCTSGSNPFEFQGTFNAPPIEKEEIGEFKGTVTMCAYLAGLRDFAFEAGLASELNVDVGPAKKAVAVSGSAKGYFHGSDFNLDGAYTLKLPLLAPISATGVVSSEGYAFCGKVGGIEAGVATNNWLVAPTDISGCDFTPYRAPTLPPAPKLRAAAVHGSRSVTVAKGERGFALAIRGATGAPRVRVNGPKGERFVAPPGKALVTKAAVILPADALKTTYVFLTKPSAGTWTVTPLPGSVPIARLQAARQLPEPRVTTKLGHKKGGKLELRWTSRKIPGQQIELVDRTDGVATTIQKRTPKGKGRVVFKPQNPLERKRRIEAVVYRDGSPRPAIVVKRYTLKATRKPAKVTGLKATRTKAGLAISWKRAARAATYEVTVRAGARVLTRTSTKLRALIYRRPPRGRLTVLVSARDALGHAGPAATASAAAAPR